MMNTSTLMMTGTPRPPLRMMAPKGAPMKKKIRHDSDSVTLLIASIWWLRSSRFRMSEYSALNSMSFSATCTSFMAMLTASCFFSPGSLM